MRLTICIPSLMFALLLTASANSPAQLHSPHLWSPQNRCGNEEVWLNALNEIRGKHYEQGRLILQKLLSPDCSLMPTARLLIADCYYREGGSSNLTNAQSEYTNWLKLFPDHKVTPLVMLKLAETLLRQIYFLGGDTHAVLANGILLKLQEVYPQFRDSPIVQEYIMVVQELLAEHSLSVARFYFDQRQSTVAAKGRCLVVIENYPKFSKMDIALWYLAQADEADIDSGETAEEAANDSRQAVESYERLVREYPDSRYWNAAIEKLRYWGRKVPEPDLEKNIQFRERSSKVAGILADLNAYAMSISRSGVLLDEGDEIAPDRLPQAVAQ